MNRTRHIAELVEQLIELKPDQRSAHIDLHCKDDPGLRAELERLLAAGPRTTAPAPPPSTRLDSDVLVGTPVFEGDDRIGPYRVIRRLGEGGLGYVVLAFRETDAFQKRVAIKLIKRGMDTDEILRRFQQERQVLASLNHPNIARVFDAGTTTDGRPFFVMEYIEGLPIDQYCDEHTLSTPERLKLFIKVCAAVHYAHQNLVIHRDIKPCNILVTPDGQPHLLDFGIAKLLNPDLLGSPVTTGPELRLMTPEYASPEQVEGRPITTASDVYSLGVLLYHLLTGRPPYQLKSRVREEMVRVICQVEPSRPSTVITRAIEQRTADGGTQLVSPEQVAKSRDGQVARLRRRLSGDLDNIVLMALRKAPKRRYASVEQFAEDIHRHLAGRAIAAHPPSPWYALQVFVKRHTIACAAAALALAAIITLSIVSTTQALRLSARSRSLAEALTQAREQKDLAQQESKVRAETATLAMGVIRDVGRIGSVRPSIPSALLASMIEAWLGRSEITSHPELSLQLHAVVADGLAATQQYERALAHAEEALRLGLKLHSEDDSRLTRLHTRVARNLSCLGRHEDALTQARRAVAITQARPGDVEALNARWRLALTLHQSGRISESRTIADEVLAAADAAGAPPIVRVNARLYASDHASLASEHPRALRLANEALGILQDGKIDGIPIATVARIRIGAALVKSGQLDEGEAQLAWAVSEGIDRIASVHVVTYDALRRHADVLHRLGRYQKAAALLQRAESFRIQQDGMRHARTAWLHMREAAAYFAAGDQTQGQAYLALAVSRGITRRPGDREWAATYQKAEAALREGNWALDEGLRQRLGDLDWLMTTDEPTPSSRDDIDTEP